MLLLATTGMAAQGSYRTLLLAAIEQRLLLFYISYGQLEREQADREKPPVYAVRARTACLHIVRVRRVPTHNL